MNLGDVRSYDARKSAQEFDEFTREYERQEQAKRDAALKPLTVVNNEVAREMWLHNFDMENLWSAPLTTINSILSNERRESMYWLLFFGNEPTSQTEEEFDAALDAYTDTVESRTGFRLNRGGYVRLTYLARIEWQHGVEANQTTLDTMLDTLLKHSCFADGEVDYDTGWKVTTVPVVPSVQPKNDSFENLSLLSDEGARQGRAIAQELYNQEAAPIVQRWCASLLTRFQFDISQEHLSAVQRWMERRNRSPRDWNALEDCRRSLVRATIFPKTALDLDDLRAICLEKLDTSDKECIRIVRFGNLEAVKDLMERKNIHV